MQKFLIAIVLFLIIYSFSNAQTGCVRTALPTRIYTSLISGTSYRSTTFTDASAGCQYALTANTCSVSGFTGTAFKGQVGVVNCPLDNDIWEITVLLGGIGCLVIRKNALK